MERSRGLIIRARDGVPRRKGSPRGLKARWRFSEITADGFHWIGEERSSDGDPWHITYEHFARRTNP